MAADLKDLLRKTLDELTGAEFKRFKYRLRDEGQIAWGTLEKADTDDTVEEMVKVYSMGAGDVMEKVLRTMNHNHLVMDLESKLKKLGCWQCYSTQSGEAKKDNAGQLQGHNTPSSILLEHKEKMKVRVENIHQGMEKTETQAPIKKIFTELYITEGKMEEVNSEHEVWQMEATFRAQATEESAICRNDIFKPFPGQSKNIKVVLTMGIAGIGKTVLVKKFIFDWCECVAHQDVDFMFMLPFREINLFEGERSLHDLLCIFCPELKKLHNMSVYDEAKFQSVVKECPRACMERPDSVRM
ncbi:NACHT, LRR and PYD domains-containing protein 6 [Engraulis encrasicolus]|uniref:NACHT, LRR and PYD domains-containing protein 6 n=1 Tax=Engraulis encrasicolus TaxID=184585 RepID=UPI002FD0F5B5